MNTDSQDNKVVSNLKGISSVNEQINAWEIHAYSDQGHAPSGADRSRAERYFNEILYYNKPFVDFLVDFYGLKGKRILDYGCGAGMFCEPFSRHSAAVSDCDISKQQLNFAKEHTNATITYFEDDFFNFGLRESYYDFIFCRGLGPLMKIDYNVENSKYLKRIMSALRDNGVAYFILLDSLGGKPGDRLTSFQNHRISTIYDFFQRAGSVAMINFFGYQAVVVAKTENVAAKYSKKMELAMENMLKNLREYDEVGYLKCKVWLFLNSGENVEPVRKEFVYVDRYVEEVIYPLLVKGICNKLAVDYPADAAPLAGGALYLVSGDQDRFFEKFYEKVMYEYTNIAADPFLRVYLPFRGKTLALLAKSKLLVLGRRAT